MQPLIQKLYLGPVIYCVFRGKECDKELIHIGEGDSLHRIFTYIQNLPKEEQINLSVKYIEVTPELKEKYPLPEGLEKDILFQGNLERLLQVAYCWGYGRMPLKDEIRGGNGSKPSCTGGFIKNVGVLKNVFDLLYSLMDTPLQDRSVPEMLDGLELAESLDPPEPSGLRGRPASRRLYLAVWADVNERRVYVGYLPKANKQLHYGTDNKQVRMYETMKNRSQV